jgi:hypothetical protein
MFFTNSKLDLLRPSTKLRDEIVEFFTLFNGRDDGVFVSDSDIERLGGFFIRFTGESLAEIDEAVVFAVMIFDEDLSRFPVRSIRDRTLLFGFILWFIFLMINHD